MDEINLGDIPDLSALSEGNSTNEWQNGWYAGTILSERSFVDRNGNERVFQSGDEPSMNGDSRNIKLQVVVTSKEGRTIHVRYLVNYRPEDLTQTTVQTVIADRDKAESEQDPALKRASISLQRLAKLQRIGGVRAFSKTEGGGLELSALWNKNAYFKLGDDDRNPQFKNIKDVRDSRQPKVPVL